MVFIKRYWIAGLVLCLVVIHAVIIGYVRSEAMKIRVAASREIPIGVYYVQSDDQQWMSQLRVHLSVDSEQQLAARATIESHRWLIHQVVEEKLRQLDPKLLEDAVLLEVKKQIKTAVEEALQTRLVRSVLINDRIELPIQHFRYQPPYDVTAPSPIYTSQTADTESNKAD